MVVHYYLKFYDKVLWLDDSAVVCANTENLFNMVDDNSIGGYNEGSNPSFKSWKNDFSYIKTFKDFEINKIQRLIDWVKTPAGFDSDTSKKNFYLYFKEQDKRRGTDFTSVFPQLTNFWNECKDKNES